MCICVRVCVCVCVCVCVVCVWCVWVCVGVCVVCSVCVCECAVCMNVDTWIDLGMREGFYGVDWYVMCVCLLTMKVLPSTV